MARLFPFRSEVEVDQEPRLVALDDEAADEVFAALSSDTARRIVAELYEEPTTASELAEAVDTSLQNVRYHLDKLQEAGLVEVVDRWYSSRGTEMKVYAPTSEPLVVAAGREERTAVLRSALRRLLGAVGVLAIASVALDRGLRALVGGRGERVAYRGKAPAAAETGRAGTATATPTPEATATVADVAAGGGRDGGAATTPSPTPAATPVETAAAPPAVPGPGRAAVEVAGTPVPPGVLFFAGGLLVLLMASAWWYWFRFRPTWG